MEIFLIIMFLLVSVFMTLVILIQKPKGGGLSGAFGGAGGGAQTAFGSKTGDVLTWFTTACFVLFLVLGVVLTLYIEPQTAGSKTGVGPATPVAPQGAGTFDPDSGELGEPGGPQAPAPEAPAEAPGATPAPGATGNTGAGDAGAGTTDDGG